MVTRMVKSLRGLLYADRLRRLNFFTIERRLLRKDLILAYNLLQGRLNVPLDETFEESAERNLRRHDCQLHHGGFLLGRRKAAFSVRLPKHGNKLPLEVVTAPFVEAFKRFMDSNRASLSPTFLDSILANY